CARLGRAARVPSCHRPGTSCSGQRADMTRISASLLPLPSRHTEGLSPAVRDRGFALFCFLYGACLLVFACFAFGAGPLHHDLTEAWAWGKEFQLGYAKH